ncbi:MAG TPA: glycosyltransferase family 4 protein [Pyrinomonadaceae bacterium]|nr:glycosyltransferase family 4 protein [Pyrinomonadaceae bacterium]
MRVDDSDRLVVGVARRGRPSFETGKGRPRRGALTKVLIVAASMDIVGGQAVQAVRLIDHLKEETAVEVEFLPVNPRLPSVLRKLQAIKYVRTITTSSLYWLKLLTTVPDFDVIHIFSASYFSFLLAPVPAVIVSRLFGKKIILNYHSGEAEDHLQRWPRTSIPLLKCSDEIVVPSTYLVRIFSKFGLPAKVIFNVIDFERFTFRQREILRPVFFSNRNFEAHYGVDVVLRAFAVIQKRFREASLKVAGNGPCRDTLHKLAADLGLRNVAFLGTVAHEQMPALYNEADCFLNGSRIDNQPLSILEAFASGLPVVTTNAGGIPDMVTDGVTGMVVEMDVHEAVAKAAIDLIEHPEIAARLVTEARKECRRYTWEAVRTQWLDVYGATDHTDDTT